MASHLQAHASTPVAHRLAGSGRKQESVPEWVRDAIDAIVVAAILLTLAMAAVLGK